MSKQQPSRGFTLVEITIALALAGLIALLVFLALGAAQRSQRDQARKEWTQRVADACNKLLVDRPANNAIHYCLSQPALVKNAAGTPPTVGGVQLDAGSNPASKTNVRIDFSGAVIMLEDNTQYVVWYD